MKRNAQLPVARVAGGSRTLPAIGTGDAAQDPARQTPVPTTGGRIQDTAGPDA
jgi:hypothetical protein